MIRLLRRLAWLCDYAADVLEYRQRTKYTIEYELEHGPKPIPIPVKW